MRVSNRSVTCGKGILEYALILILVVVGIAIVLQLMGISISDVYCDIVKAISGKEVCANKEYCADDFSSTLEGWKTTKGSSNLNNGQMCISGIAMTFNECSLRSTNSDYTINLDGAILTNGDGYGVFFRTTNIEPDRYGYTHQNGYSFQYDKGYGGFIIEKWVNGNHINPPLAVALAKGYNWYNKPKNIKLVVKGDTFSAYIDGVLVLTGKDSTFSEGGTGLRSWDSSVTCFDHYGVENIP